jgi:phosphatidate cytidylyltransferase
MALHKKRHKSLPGAWPKLSGTRAAGDILNRMLSSAVVGVVVIGGIMIGGRVWQALASFIALGSLWELYQMMSSKYKISRGWGLAGGFFILGSVSLGFSFAVTLSIMTVTAFAVLFTEVVRRQSTGESFALWNMGGTLSGLIYIILPWSFLILVRSETWGYIFLLTIFLCTWCCDIGAYLGGSWMGRTPFASRVSPKKSWEGVIFGFLASFLCGCILPVLFQFAPMPLALMGLLCGFAGPIGDLGESVLKREAGVKDTGKAIPGHGGFLDRFDSILINATLAFFIFEVIS